MSSYPDPYDQIEQNLIEVLDSLSKVSAELEAMADALEAELPSTEPPKE